MECPLTLDIVNKLDHPLPDVRLRWLLYILKAIKHSNFKNHVIAFSITLKLSEWIKKYPQIEEKNVLQSILDLVKRFKVHFSIDNLNKLINSVSCGRKRVLPEHQFLTNLIEEELSEFCLGSACKSNISDSNEVESIKVSSNDFSEYSFEFSTIPQYQIDLKDVYKIEEVAKLIQNGYVAQGCTRFIYDLMLNYPPEVFLHCPTILENLLIVLECDKESIKFGAINCLNTFILRLIQRSKNNFTIIECVRNQNHDESVSQMEMLTADQFCIKVLKPVLRYFKDGEYKNCPEYISYAFQEICINLIVLLKNVSIPLVNADEIAEGIATVISIFRHCRNSVLRNLLYFQFLLVACDFCKNFNNSLLLSELEECIMDPVLEHLHGDVHARLISVASKMNSPILNTYENVKGICQLLDSAMDVIKHRKSSNTENLDSCMIALPAVEILNSFTLIESIIQNCSKILNYKKNELLNEATSIILKLLSFNDEKVKLWVYTCINKQMKQFLGVHKSAFTSLRTTLDIATGIPINSEIIIEIACRGIQHQNREISSLASNILIMLLKSNMTTNQRHWAYIVEHLVPALPIIQCITNKDTVLGQNLYELVNPDVASKVNLRFGDILKSNIRLLFSKDPEVRQESISRLLYLLDKRTDSAGLLPKCSIIAGTLHSNLCIHTDNQVRIGVRSKEPLNFHSVSAINPLLEIISNEHSDPCILKSSVLQLSIILDDCYLHGVFSTIEDIQMILNLFPKMLALDGFKDYSHTLIAVVNILRKLCSYNKVLRSHLSQCDDVLTYILRALFLLYENPQLRLDCSQLLFLICWSTWLINDSHGLSGNFILENMHLPCSISYHDRESPHALPSLKDKMLDTDSVNMFIKYFVHLRWFNNKTQISENELASFRADINGELLLNEQELAYLTSSGCSNMWMHYLDVIKHARSHKEVKNALHGFSSISNLQYPEEPQIQQITVYLEKFLHILPASKSDKQLFISILNFIKKTAKHDEAGGRVLLIWAVRTVRDNSGPIISMIRNYKNLENVEDNLYVEVLITISFLYKEFSKLADSELDVSLSTKSEYNNELDLKLIQIFNEKEILTNSTVNCSRLLLCICYIDLVCIKDLHITVLIKKIISWLWLLNDDRIRKSKQIGNNDNCIESMNGDLNKNQCFTSVSIIMMRSLVTTLCNAIRYMKINSKQSKSVWFEEFDKSVTLLSSLCTSPDIFVRSCSYQILSGLLYTGEGSLFIMKKFTFHFGTFWFTCLNTLVDNNEPILSRYQSGCCIVNLSSHIGIDIKETLLAFATEHLLDINNKYDIIKHLLDITEFSKCVYELMSSLYVGSSDSSYVCREDYEKTRNDIYEEWGAVMPDLIRVFVLFMHNLTFISPNIVDYLFERKVLSNLLRCVRVEVSAMDVSVEKLITAICNMFSCMITLNKNIGTSLVMDPGSMYCLTAMLDTSNGFKHKLYCGIYHLFSQLAKFQAGFDAIILAIQQCDENSFLKTLCFSLSQSDNEDLKICSFVFMVNILQTRIDGKDFYHILDNAEFKDENRVCTYRVRIIEVMIEIIKRQFLVNETVDKKNCLFEVCINSLSMCMYMLQHVCNELKELHKLLLQRLHASLQNLYDKCAENLKKLLDKKRQAEAEEIKLIINLLCAFYTNMNFKNNGLIFEKTDKIGKLSICTIIQKLIPFCSADDAFLNMCLECLHNYTDHCLLACRDMTNSPGVSFSRLAGLSTDDNKAKCMLSMIINLVIQNNTKTHKKSIMKLLLSILKNACYAVEGRVAVYKSEVLSHIKSKTPKSLPDNFILWIDFLLCFSKYSEGQLSIVKNNELLSTLIVSSENKSKLISSKSLAILRNISFNTSNKIVLLNSKTYITATIAALRKSDLEELLCAVIIIWNLSANNQRAKYVMKSHNVHDQIIEMNIKFQHRSEDSVCLNILMALLNGLQRVLNVGKNS